MRPLRVHEVPLHGRRLIEASAGTGKTHTITTLVLRLLLERRLRIDQILVVTFTRAATAELRDRIRRRITRAARAFALGSDADDEQLDTLARATRDRAADQQHLLEAAHAMDEAPVHTIHGFCERALADHAFESGARFDAELVIDPRPAIAELVADFWTRELYALPPRLVQYVRETSPLDRLHALATLAVGQPDLRIVPEPVPVDPEAALAAARAIRLEVAAEWPSVRGAVEGLLLNDSGLNRRSYPFDAIPGWMATLDLCFEHPDPIEKLPLDVLVRLTPEGMAPRMRQGHAPPQHPYFERLAQLVAAERDSVAALEQWLLGLQHRLVTAARTELAARKRVAAQRTFDDLLLDLRAALRGPAGAELAATLAARYPVALIDEFQDTDPVQYEILHRIYPRDAANRALFLIGDPKQAIYAFRGADVFAYLDAVAELSGEVLTLDRSYRADPALLAATNELFGRCERPFLLDRIEYRRVEPKPGATERLRWPEGQRAPFELLFLPKGQYAGRRDAVILRRGALGAVCGVVARSIASLLAARVHRVVEPGLEVPVRAGDIAVLARTHDEATALQEALLTVGVPSVVHGDRSVLDTPEAEEVASVLTALAAPADARALRGALVTSLFQLDAVALDRLAESETEWELWLERFAAWHELWVRRGFIAAFRRLLRDQRVIPRLLGLPRGERRLTNVLHVVELLHDAALRQHLGVPGLVRWFDQVASDPSAREEIAPEAMQLRLESDARAVQITTLHASKGLEYPIVYCPFLWEPASLRRYDRTWPRFHDPEANLRLTLQLAGDRDRAKGLAAEEALAEGLRLAYVGLTRAQHRCVVVTGGFRSFGASPLASLLHRPELVPGAPQHTPAERVKNAPDELLLADLRQLAAAVPHAIEVTVADDAPAPPVPEPPPPTLALAARPLTRRFTDTWRTSSFSGLIARHTSQHVPVHEGRDHDEDTEPGPRPQPTPEPLPLDELPRGPAAGNVLHALLEAWALAPEDERAPADVLRAALPELLQGSPIDATRWEEPLTQALADALATPITPEGLHLSGAPRADRFPELEFTLAVSPKGEANELTPTRLAGVFRAHAGPELAQHYAPRLAELDFSALTGFLRGFIDLIVIHQGRWLVVDYKSNHLGSKGNDYNRASLFTAMVQHHYLLQAHLYVVALHRLLRLRVPNYTYERDCAGYSYLFLRGMAPAHGLARGVFHERPPRALIDALDALLAGTPELP